MTSEASREAPRTIGAIPPRIDRVRLRAYRMDRVQAELRARDCGACLLHDPVNILYAIGVRNMQVWSLHMAVRHAVVPAEGKATLFEFGGSEHLVESLETVGEVRTAIARHYAAAGVRTPGRLERWANEILAVVRRDGQGNSRLAVDRHLDYHGGIALARQGLELHDAQPIMSQATLIKSPEEIACMRYSVSICEDALAHVRAALEPGVSENELWALYNARVLERGAEWVDTRLLSSGERTNPWFQEAGDRTLRAGDLLAFDTDTIGPFGYAADLSRTFLCPPARPTAAQRRLYRAAYDEVHHNLALNPPRSVLSRVLRAPMEAPGRIPAGLRAASRDRDVQHLSPDSRLRTRLRRVRRRVPGKHDGVRGKLHRRGGWTRRSQARGAMPGHRRRGRAAVDFSLRGGSDGE